MLIFNPGCLSGDILSLTCESEAALPAQHSINRGGAMCSLNASKRDQLGWCQVTEDGMYTRQTDCHYTATPRRIRASINAHNGRWDYITRDGIMALWKRGVCSRATDYSAHLWCLDAPSQM